MKNLEKLYEHPFVKNFLNDTAEYGLIEKEIDEDNLSELECYIYNTMFYGVHLLSLFEQLQNAVELLSNYNYSKIDEIGRGKHLTYNVENYIIRFISISDRLLQTINAVFHLGNTEKIVSERIILSNLKVSMTEIPNSFKEFKKTLADFDDGNRNTIIHRHSYINKELNQIEKFYHPALTDIHFQKASNGEIEKFKNVRKLILTNFIKNTKQTFKENNELCFEKILPIFNILNEQYSKIKIELKENVAYQRV